MAGHGAAGDAAVMVLLVVLVAYLWHDHRRVSGEQRFVEEVEAWRLTHHL